MPGLAWDVFTIVTGHDPVKNTIPVDDTIPIKDTVHGFDSGTMPADASTHDVVSPLLVALNALQKCPCVVRAGLVSDHLRAITPLDVDEGILRQRLAEAGITDVRFELVEPSLEDVFLALAGA